MTRHPEDPPASGRRVVTLEVPASWFANPEDGARHRTFYSSLLVALAELDVLIDPVWLPRGAERAPRGTPDGRFLISFHSYGEAGNILRCKESYIPPFYTMDRLGYSCFSELARFPERFRGDIDRQDEKDATAFLDDLGATLRRTNRSKYTQPPGDAAALQEGYVFVPLQTQTDSVAQGTSIEIDAALRCIVAAASARGLRTVVKRHPLCRSRLISDLLAELDRNPDVILSHGSIHDLIPGAEMVVGANSGVLFEALLQSRPVISFATSDFGLAVQQVHSLDTLAEAVACPEPPDPAWRRKFLFWYLNDYCVRFDDSVQIRQKVRSLFDAPQTGSASRPIRKLELYAYSLLDRIKRRFF